MRARIVSLLAALYLPVFVFAQTDSKAVGRNASAALAGSTAVSGPGSADNRDYLSPFISALESLKDSKGQLMTFDWNFPLGVFGENHRGKAQVILKKPPLSDAVTKALANSKAELDALREDLALADHVTVTLSVSPNAATKPLEARASFDRAATTIGLTSQFQTARVPGVSALDEDSNRLLKALDNSGGVERALEVLAEGKALGAVQAPKFTFDATYHARRDIAGPDEVVVKARYEWGKDPTNANEALASPACAAQFNIAEVRDACSSLVAAVMTVKQDPQFRVVADASFHSLRANDIVLSPTLTVPGKSSRSLVGSVSAGFDVYRPDVIEHRGRLQLEVTYDDVSNDPLRKDRLIGTLTYTQRITEKIQIPIKLVYANHADYLTNVDRKLNAHVGLSYKLPGL